MKRMLSICLAIALLFVAVPVVPSMALSQYGTVTGGWLRLRSGPSFDSSTISSYYTGTSVKILGTSGNWYQVETPDSKTGYMYASYISFSGGGEGNAYVTSSNGLGVRMRTGPGTGYSVIGIFSVGTAVTVLETAYTWSKIQIGTRVGYMMNRFLTTGGGGGGETATIWSANGYGVRLRSGPGTGYSILGVYSVGTTVTIISHGSTWDHISVGSRTGYMMNCYLNASGQGVATAITLTAPSGSAAQGSTVTLTPTVTGTNLSNPAYTLAVTQNASMAALSGTSLTILGTATVGAVVQVTATTTNNNSTGSKLTAVCSITVTASTGVVTAFSFDKTTATAMVTSSGGSLDVVPTILGTNLTLPLFTLAVNTQAAGYVTATRDATTGKILINISSIIPDGTVFTVTGTTLNPTSSGTVLTATITVTVTKTGTLSSITLTPQSTSINSGAYTLIDVRLNYSNGSYVTNPASSMYTLTPSSAYGTVSEGNKLTGTNAGTTDQVVTVTGVATANTSITSTCTVTVKGLSKPSAPTLSTVKAENAQVRVTWAAPSNTGGSAITKYWVYYSTSSTFSATNYREITTGLTCVVDGLTNGTPYYFWVSAFNGQGESAVSNSLSATPAIAVPDAPTDLTVVSTGNGTVNLSWTAPYNGGAAIDAYNVYYGTTYQVATTNSVSVTGLTNGTTYSFYVKAHNTKGESAASGTVTATPTVTSSASVTMVAPVAGATPQNAAAVEAATAQTYFTVSGLTWNQSMTGDGKFKAAETYSASVVLTSKGRPFQAASFTPTVSGAASVGTTTTTGTDIGNTVSFTVTFSATAAKAVASIAVSTQPTKMSYTESTDGTLALDGMVVTQTYNDGTTDTVTFTDGTATGYTASPADGTTLTAATHNGTKVTVTHTATSQTAQTGALTVAAAPTYIISLDPSSDHPFGDTTPYTVTVANAGTATISGIGVSLSDSTAFDLTPMTKTSLTSGETDTFTVTPKSSGLTSGTPYSSTVSVFSTDAATRSFTVTYTAP